MMIKIETIDDYFEVKEFASVDPLLIAWDNNNSLFYMPIQIRVDIQKLLFFAKTHNASLNKFYRWMWDNKPHYCEETGTPLYHYGAIHISHILTRGAHPEKAFDPRNINILIPSKHTQWETGERSEMQIYWKNQSIIERLNSEYNKLKCRKL